MVQLFYIVLFTLYVLISINHDYNMFDLIFSTLFHVYTLTVSLVATSESAATIVLPSLGPSSSLRVLVMNVPTLRTPSSFCGIVCVSKQR